MPIENPTWTRGDIARAATTQVGSADWKAAQTLDQSACDSETISQ